MQEHGSTDSHIHEYNKDPLNWCQAAGTADDKEEDKSLPQHPE